MAPSTIVWYEDDHKAFVRRLRNALLAVAFVAFTLIGAGYYIIQRQADENHYQDCLDRASGRADFRNVLHKAQERVVPGGESFQFIEALLSELPPIKCER